VSVVVAPVASAAWTWHEPVPTPTVGGAVATAAKYSRLARRAAGAHARRRVRGRDGDAAGRGYQPDLGSRASGGPHTDTPQHLDRRGRLGRLRPPPSRRAEALVGGRRLLISLNENGSGVASLIG